MKHFLSVLSIELFKIRKSKVIWLTVIAASLAPLMASFFTLILKYPGWMKKAGLLGAQAQVAGAASWPDYLNLYGQMLAVGGILIFGFITSWIFGREYTDGTIKDFLVLPYSRVIVVLAKFSAMFITSILISLYIVLFGCLLGWFIGLSGWSGEVLIQGIGTITAATFMTIMLSTPTAFFASYGKGYLAPIGFVILLLIFSQIIAAADLGEFFPWSIPALYSGISEVSLELTWVHLLLIFCPSILGVLSTLEWWRYGRP